MGWGPAGGSVSSAHDWAKRLREQDPSFTALYILRFRRFNDEDAHLLFDALAGNHTLLELSSSHRCSPQQAADLSRALVCNATLKSLTIGDGELGDESLENLLPGFAASRSLKQLEMGGAPLSPDVAERLGSALSQGSITHLSLSRKTMKEGSLEALAPGLTHLSHLDLSGCGLGISSTNAPLTEYEGTSEAAGAALAKVLSGGNLRSLAIPENALGTAFCRQLAHGLQAATQLSSLNLSGNAIGSDGCLAITSQLQNALASSQSATSSDDSSALGGLAACQLAALDMGGCSISDSGFAAVCDAIERGVPLQIVNVSRASLSAAGLAAGLTRLSAAAFPCRLENLDVSGSHGCIDDSSVAALGGLVSLRKLSLFDCALGGNSGGIIALIQLLRGGLCNDGKLPFRSLVDLDLCGNDLELQQLQQLLDVLQQGCLPTLKILVMGANPGTDNSEAFAEVAQPLMDSRPLLDVMWRAAGGGAA